MERNIMRLYPLAVWEYKIWVGEITAIRRAILAIAEELKISSANLYIIPKHAIPAANEGKRIAISLSSPKVDIIKRTRMV